MGTTYASQVIDERAAKPRSSFWRELPILLGVAIVVAILVRAFLVQTFFIPSESMENTLLINDRVLVNKLVYDFRDPHRGEIVVFKAPMDWRSDPNEEDFIKRVIGVGGDHVVCCDSEGRISVNEVPLIEPYLYRDGAGNADVSSEDEFDVVIPAGRLWVMGDHRSHSGDSREQYTRHGNDPPTERVLRATISVDDVVGRAFVLFWPLGRAGWLTPPETFAHIPAPGT
jgi:signal peptidase I